LIDRHQTVKFESSNISFTSFEIIPSVTSGIPFLNLPEHFFPLSYAFADNLIKKQT